MKQVGLNSVSTSDFSGSASNMPVSVLDRWQTVGDTSGGQLFTAGFNGDAVNNFIVIISIVMRLHRCFRTFEKFISFLHFAQDANERGVVSCIFKGKIY